MSLTRPKFQRPLVLTGHSAAVYALCPWQDGFLSGDGNGLIVYWQHRVSGEGSVLAQIPDRVFCMQPLPNNQLVVGTLSGDLFWIDLNAPKDQLPKRWRLHKDGLFGLLRCEGDVYAIGGKGNLSKWSTATGEMILSQQLDNVRLRSIAFLSNTGCLAIGTGNGDVHLVDRHSLRIMDTITQAHELTVFSIVDTGPHFITAGRDGQLRTWLARDPFGQVGHVAAHAATVNALAFRQNLSGGGKISLMASAGRDRETRIWNVPNDEAATELVLAKALTATRDGGHPASVNCCIWIDDVLVTGGDDRTVRVWPLV